MKRLSVKITTSSAVLPLPKQCVEAVKQRRMVAARDREAAEGHDTSRDWCSRPGECLDPRNFQRAFKSAVARAGVPVIPLHSLRPTCATLLVELNAHPRVAMQILRHSEIAVTMDIYSQVSGETTRDALDKLGDSLGAE